MSAVFENLGHTGVVEDMKNSLSSIIDKRFQNMKTILLKMKNYASISNEEDIWLYKDTSFMTAQFLKKCKGLKAS